MTSNFTYCTYVTFYSGNKLPPFYIGSSNVAKVQSGYHGSVSSQKYIKIWKSELKQNPHLFRTKIISYHETKEESLVKEEKLQRQLNVVKSSMYINMCYARKGFDSTRPEIGEAISRANRGQKRPNISKALMGHKRSKESIEKSRKANTGKKRTSDFCKQNKIKSPEEIERIRNTGYKNKGNIRSTESKQKQSAKRKNFGLARCANTKENLGLIDINDPRWKTGEIEGFRKGAKNNLISEKLKGSFPCKNSKTGIPCGMYSKTSPEFISGEVVGIRKVLKLKI